MRLFINLLVIIFACSGCKAKKSIPLIGHFEGYFSYKDKRLNAAIDFEYHNGKRVALLSVPDNLQLNKPYALVEYNAPSLKLMMKDGEVPITIRATVIWNVIDGKLDGSIPITIHLTKVEKYVPVSKGYTIEEIILNNNGLKFSANLYLPKTNLPSQAVIMVAGSGNHAKDEYNGAADLFASKGIATLTFDKRNVTGLPGINIKHINSDIATMKDLVSDVETAFYYLKTKKQVDQKKIGLLGFSLGAVEVPVVAATHPDIAFVVAISGNATTDKEFIINQAANSYMQNGYDSQTIEKAEALYNDFFTYAKTRLNWQMLQAKLDKAYAENWGQLCFPPTVPDDNELKYLLTWNNFDFDPAGYWKKIKVPCFVAYGEKDKYIPVERSIQILQKAFEDRKGLLTIRCYNNADHAIKITTAKGNFEFQKYATGYINDVLNWLLKQGR